MKLNARVLIPLLLTGWASTAHSHVISLATVGDSFTVDWLLESNAADGNGNINQTSHDIRAQAIFTLDVFDHAANFVDMTVSLANTTASNSENIGLWKMGFGTDPNVTGVLFDDVMDGLIKNAYMGAFPAFPDSALIDVTSYSGSGAPRTLQHGDVDVFGLRLSFLDLLSTSEINLDPFNVFFQSDKGSYQFASLPPPPPEPVPEPSALFLLGLSMMLLGWLGVRRRIPQAQ